MKINYNKVNGYHHFIKEHFKGEPIYNCWTIHHEITIDGEYKGEVFETNKDSFLGKGWTAIRNNKIIKTNCKTRKEAVLILAGA